MEPLHRDVDETLGGIIEPAEGGVAEPFDRRFPSDFGLGIVGLDRIIDDQDLAATAGERAADRGGQARAPLCGLEFTLGRLLGI
jgi:hypothetical protein